MDDAWVCIQRSPRRDLVADTGFALTAVGVDNLIREEGLEWSLWVPSQQHDEARRQLEQYRHDLAEAEARAAVPEIPPIDKGHYGIAGFLAVIWLVPVLQGYGILDQDAARAGAMNAGAVMSGEWWRTITALTLHGDFGHILGNSGFGLVIGLMVGRNLGSGLGWLLVLASGALGNGINAWLQADAFTAIGASTATFAALGMVGAYVWQRGSQRAFGLRRSLAPLFAAFALLAFTGVGGENTDVVGHFTGFAAGGLIGLAASGFAPERLTHRGQGYCGMAAIALVALSWGLALLALA